MATYYVDRVNGSDTANGNTEATAWQSITKVNAVTFTAGDQILFRRGQTHPNAGLVAASPGTGAARIVYGSYGTGALPVLDGGYSAGPIVITGAYNTVQDLLVQSAGGTERIGVAVRGTDALIQRVTSTGNAFGVAVATGAHRARITGCTINDNTVIVSGPGTADDYGATGVIVHQADNCEIDNNTINGNIGVSADYGTDGAAVDINGSQNSTVHHNRCTNNFAFAEIGHTRTTGTRLHNNLVTAALDSVLAINVQGTGPRGPVLATTFVNNTVVLPARHTLGILTGVGATAVVHNNIVWCEYLGWTGDGKVDEGHNVYFGGGGGNDIASTDNPGFGISATSVLADPAFVSTADFHLQSISPAINRGVSNYNATTDLDGNARTVSGAVDAGCYEYVPGSTPAPTPTAPADTTPTPTTYSSQPLVGTVGGVPRIYQGWVGGNVLTFAGVSVWGITDSITEEFGDRQWTNRVTTVNTLNSWGANSVRLRFFLQDYNRGDAPTKAAMITKLKGWRDLVLGKDMYLVVCFWDALYGDFGGANMAGTYQQALTVMGAVIEQLGRDERIIYEPWNEPNNITDAQWLTAMRATVTTFRTQIRYRGVLMLNSTNWSHNYLDSMYTELEALDASTLGSHHQLVFNRHDYADDYPNLTWNATTWYNAVGGNQSKHVICESEFGNWNGSDTTMSITWSQAAASFFGTRAQTQPTFAGAIAFLYGPWYDGNATTGSDFVTPTAWGAAVRDRLLLPAKAKRPSNATQNAADVTPAANPLTLPTTTRFVFGGDLPSWTAGFGVPMSTVDTGQLGRTLVGVGTVDVTFWDAPAGGNQYLQLTDGAGNSIYYVTASAGITSRLGQIPMFYGPPGVFVMYAQAGDAPRLRLVAQDAYQYTTEVLAANNVTGMQSSANALTTRVQQKEGVASAKATALASVDSKLTTLETWLRQPVTELRATATTTLVSGTWTSIEFGSFAANVDQDNVGGWNSNSASRFTSRYTGWYLVSGTVAFTGGATSGRYTRWAINGQVVLNGGTCIAPNTQPVSSGSSTIAAVTASANTMLVRLAATDYIELQAMQNTGSNLTTHIVSAEAAHLSALYIRP